MYHFFHVRNKISSLFHTFILGMKNQNCNLDNLDSLSHCCSFPQHTLSLGDPDIVICRHKFEMNYTPCLAPVILKSQPSRKVSMQGF